ncbi:hypothetical protein PanWU01x14_127440, partial [Parasponia andersonii]
PLEGPSESIIPESLSESIIPAITPSSLESSFKSHPHQPGTLHDTETRASSLPSNTNDQSKIGGDSQLQPILHVYLQRQNSKGVKPFVDS